MINWFKKVINQFVEWLFYEEHEKNTYCIPCRWEVAGHINVTAYSLENAKVYLKTHPVAPELEECLCYKMTADTEHPILCTCGCCGEEYVVSAIHKPQVCPNCGNGGERIEKNLFC